MAERKGIYLREMGNIYLKTITQKLRGRFIFSRKERDLSDWTSPNRATFRIAKILKRLIENHWRWTVMIKCTKCDEEWIIARLIRRWPKFHFDASMCVQYSSYARARYSAFIIKFRTCAILYGRVWTYARGNCVVRDAKWIRRRTVGMCVWLCMYRYDIC